MNRPSDNSPGESSPEDSSPLHRSASHESAAGHVTGAAIYTDDLSPPGCLHGVVVSSPVAHGRLLGVDTSRASTLPGVRKVITAADIPGDPLVGPIVHDEPVLAEGTVSFKGQAIAVVFAESRDAAWAAAQEVSVQIEPLPAVLDLQEAISRDMFHTVPHVIARGGDVDEALAQVEQTGGTVVSGEVRVPGQDHFYLETQACLVVPEEGGAFRLISSTQHPTECQRMAARVLGIAESLVSCEVPRMGGGFGGKESQATQPACWAALGALYTRRPCKVWLERHEDMSTTGGRHPFLGRYRAGFDSDGRIEVLDVQLFSDGGWTVDLSGPVLDRALFHLDLACFVPTLRFEGRVVATHKPSNTAFRGFGGPQGMVVAEHAIRAAARAQGKLPEQIRRASYYGSPGADGVSEGRDRAPYGQQIPAPRILAMHDALVAKAELAQRREDIREHNANSRYSKRGIGSMAVKFGISFTASLLNQAGALVHVYADGSVQLNHGGTEMGQGLHSKMLAVCSHELGVPVDRVRQMRTSTDKVPNTSATAASSGTDLNGAAVKAACSTVRERMAVVARDLLAEQGHLDANTDPAELVFANNRVYSPDRSSFVDFPSLANTCWVRQVSLSATGYYATPGIAYDASVGQGRPFFYFTYGMAIVETELLGLTGEQRLRRVDILNDVGDSLIPSIDKGQIEGAFVQGLGWLTDEEVRFRDDGAVHTVGPSTYKVPTAGDIPRAFHVELLADATEDKVVGGSKAVGEPPFMLAIAVLEALEHAVSAFGPHPFELALPAHPENLLRAVEQAKGRLSIEG